MKTKKDQEMKLVSKQRIAELKKQKKMTEKELDDLNGRTTKGKMVSFFVFLLLLVIMSGTLIGMAKLNVGGVADNVLAPVIADVPVARSILPKRLQKKNASEIAAEKKAAADAKAAEKAKKEAEKKAAAVIFINMMSGNIDLVAKILKNMPSNKRADIIANMDALSAAQITAFNGGFIYKK